jgi:C1A family cysteine protease
MKRTFLVLVAVCSCAALITSTEAHPSRSAAQRAARGTMVAADLASGQTQSALARVQARVVARQTTQRPTRGKRNPRGKNATRGFDWTTLGIATQVRDQGQTGTCWAHAGVEALEASVEILSDTFPLLAVQPVLDQTRDNSGGNALMVFTELTRTGTGLTRNHPFLGGRLNPPPNGPLPYRAQAWGIIHNQGRIPTTAQIKSALVQNGPLYTTLYAATPAFMRNRGPQVLAEKGPFPQVDHAVLIVGWDETKKAWKIKNSWGTRWGDGGFAWVAYGHYRIGTTTTWVQALVNP